jgi:flagellar hook-associated protein 1 FlgK
LRLGNPITGTDLTAVDTLGGRIGELINLRDRILPTYQAQIDEVAHKTATRFSSQGLDMFTKLDGSIPANTPTSYVGFAAEMVINPEIISDYSVVRKGTSANSTVQTGSSEILRKVVEFAFGDTAYQQSRGTVDISNAVPTLFTTLGITGQARVVGTTNIQSLSPLDSSPSINPPTQNDFTLQVGAGVPQTITITAGMTASGLVTAINTAIPGMAQIGSGGELILRAGDTITIGAGTLGSTGLAELGLTAGATAATAPSFTIKAGNNPLTTISITSTDTSTQLLAKLNAVNGITATLTSGGFLNIIPTEGGDITVTDGTGAPLTALGMTQTNVAHTPFNTTGLGPAGTLSGEVKGASTIQNYISQAISLQSQEAKNTDTSFQSEETYRATIEKEYLNSTGVNIDEEMARLITIQTAYSASARTIQIAQEMIDELFSVFR